MKTFETAPTPTPSPHPQAGDLKVNPASTWVSLTTLISVLTATGYFYSVRDGDKKDLLETVETARAVIFANKERLDKREPILTSHEQRITNLEAAVNATMQSISASLGKIENKMEVLERRGGSR